MIQRATDATFINAVLNHPSVRPHVHGKPGPLDMTAAIQDPNNLVLTGEHGGMILVQHIPGCWEIHTQVLPEGRGRWALEMAQSCMDWLFSKTNATDIFTRIPAGNIAAEALTRACGAMLEERVWQDLGDGPGWVKLYSGRIQDWIKIAPGLVERGERFHRMLKEKAAVAEITTEDHPDNEWHDRHVGAAAGMIMGGQPIKGVLVFNRWAAMGLAPPIKLMSLDPLIIDITDCRLKITGDDFEVMSCQPV